MSIRRAGVLTLFAAGLAWAQEGTIGSRALDPQKAAEDVRLTRRALETIHPGLDRYTDGAVLSAAFDALERDCLDGISEREFFAHLSTVLALVRCSHTKAEPSPAWESARDSTPSSLPFRFVIDDAGGLVVVSTATDRLARGDRVLAIDGVPTSRIVGTLAAGVPADGWTDGARRFDLEGGGDFPISQFDHLYPAYFDVGPALRLEVLSPGQARARAVEVPALTRKQAEEAFADEMGPRDLIDAVEFRMLEPGVGYLKIDTFVAYRSNVDPVTLYAPIFEQLAAQKAESLIIDVRLNGGGSDNAYIALLAHLIDQPKQNPGKAWVKNYRYGDLTDRVETWDRSFLELPDEAFEKLDNGYYQLRSDPFTLQPLPNAFRGRVLALCGPANASGATIFLTFLKQITGATLVGEPTGGSAEGPTGGLILFLPLAESGLRVRIPAIRSVLGVPGADPRGGLSPDELVVTTPADVLGDRDPVLERALELARPPR